MVVANVVKLAAKIGEEIDIRERLAFLPVDLLKCFASVIAHIQFRRGAREGRVPGAAFRAVEAASGGVGMRECRVHNMRVRKAKDQFPQRNFWKQSSFSEQAIVGGALQLE